MWHKSSSILNFLRINFYEKSAVAISSIVVYCASKFLKLFSHKTLLPYVFILQNEFEMTENKIENYC